MSFWRYRIMNHLEESIMIYYLIGIDILLGIDITNEFIYIYLILLWKFVEIIKLMKLDFIC